MDTNDSFLWKKHRFLRREANGGCVKFNTFVGFGLVRFGHPRPKWSLNKKKSLAVLNVVQLACRQSLK